MLCCVLCTEQLIQFQRADFENFQLENQGQTDIQEEFDDIEHFQTYREVENRS